MKNPDVKALRDEITLMISENRKKDRIIDEQREQIQNMTEQIQSNRLSRMKEFVKNGSS